jgi:hypothetical protein
MTAGSAAAEGAHLSLGGVCSRHHSRIIYHITSGAKFAHANPSTVAQHDGFLISQEIGSLRILGKSGNAGARSRGPS